MRILLVVHQFLPRYSSGTEVLTRDTGIELSNRGHEVHVLTVDPHPKVRPDVVEADDYEFAGLRVHALRLPAPPSQVEELEWEYVNPLAADHVGAYVSALRPDAVHVFHLLHLSASVIEPLRALEVPLVMSATDFWSFCVRGNLSKPSGEMCRGPDDISSNCLECRRVDEWFPARVVSTRLGRRRYFRRIARAALAERPDEQRKVLLSRRVLARTRALHDRVSQFDMILAPTRLTYELMLENGFGSHQVRLSPYGMDAEPFRRMKRLAGGTATSNGARLRIGFIGTLTEHKGVHVLIQAFRSLPKDPSVTLRICGGLGDYPTYSRSILNQIAEHPRINLAGRFPNDRMADELSRIDVLVVPSVWYENAPLVVYAALAAGVPVVATDLGGLSETISHGQNGLLFEPADAADLARQLRRLVDEPGLLAALREGAHEHRSVVDSVDEFLELYESLNNGSAVVG